ncbi:hypothetical protein C5E45_32820 [Nocardia nova]|uniref:Uncharacterized protein n=2 Tax=Nocardia nova TaxID=37330 RepID=A0A2S6ACS9_9NOCA|nr:hypothetical protein C5E45_32820 [Nocardia nova]
MGTVPAADPLGGAEVSALDSYRARLTVARHATDSADCAELLDMLGLGGEPLCIDCGEKMTRAASDGRIIHGAQGRCWKCHRNYLDRKRQEAKDATAAAQAAVEAARRLRPAPPPLCERCYRRDAVEGSDLCAKCAKNVPAQEVRELVNRIQAATEMSVAAMSARIGMDPKALHQIIAPGCVRRHLGRDKFDRLAALAEEVGA